MITSKRLEDLEDNLTPQEAIILWMREVHAFASYSGYCDWLLDQPEETFPLIRLPRQVVAAVRNRHKGMPDQAIRDELFQVQKEVVFLYFIHKEMNLRLYLDDEVLRVRAALLAQMLRVLMLEKWARDDLRLERLDLVGTKSSRPTPVERRASERLRVETAQFTDALEAFLARLLIFKDAAEFLSKRYFAGQDLLFPDLADSLDWNLKAVNRMKDACREQIQLVPESDKEFRAYVLRLVSEEGQDDPVPRDATRAREDAYPEVSREARRLAWQVVLSAKTQTLEKLGEARAAEAMAEELIRSLAS
jgi:hypothetical protein